MKRYVSEAVKNLAQEKFVLLTGARQVGKTTLAKNWLIPNHGSYLNWDIPSDRETILKFFKQPITAENFVFDELHKYARWKAWLKGLYDKENERLHVLVTGSARLDLFQRGGDSLLGRHELIRLHPLSIGELTHGKLMPPPKRMVDWSTIKIQKVKRSIWDRLANKGGFPEPYLKNDNQQHHRWSSRRRQLLIQEDIRTLTDIKNLSLIEHLALLLPERVASVLSVNSLREDLQVAHNTVSNWLDALERIYYCFKLKPYSSKIARSLKKEQKVYLWDWSQVESPSARFENMIANHLLKAVHAWSDLGYGDYELMYWRDKQKREVDFMITKNRKPLVLFEAKQSDKSLSPHLTYLSHQLNGLPKIQLVNTPNIDFRKGSSRIVSADAYLANLP
jgi:uncharacterized protein